MRRAAILALLALAACAPRPENTAKDSVLAAVGDPDAIIQSAVYRWTPQYQRTVCGLVTVGPEYRRFVTLLTSENKAASTMVEGPTWSEKEAFTDIIWQPACGYR